MMDYPRRARLKLLGRARSVDLAAMPELSAALIDEAYGAAFDLPECGKRVMQASHIRDLLRSNLRT
jgi:hypothetical protein